MSERGPDRTVEVCREFLRERCRRGDGECKYAHPPPDIRVIDGRVTCCVDFIKGRCRRDHCRYYHPPPRVGDAVLMKSSSSGGRGDMDPMKMEDGMPGVNVLNPQLADVIRGYRNALDAALMMSAISNQSMPPEERSRGPASDRRQNDSIEVCRQFLRNQCNRAEGECRYAHPPNNVHVNSDNTVRACIDFIKGRCDRSVCRYFHPPDHLRSHVSGAYGGSSQANRKRSYDRGGNSSRAKDEPGMYMDPHMYDRGDGYDDVEPSAKRLMYGQYPIDY